MLTVLLATRTRGNILHRVLNEYCKLESPSGGWKLVIVDNGGTDRTQDVVRSFEDRLPVTYQLEPRGGKSKALNTGLASIEGDLVVLTDDDAFPRPDWLVQIRQLADAHPGFAVFGGVVLPRWEVAPPNWILTLVPMGPAFTLSNPSQQEGPTTQHSIYGPNMAIRSQVFHSGYRFEESLGPLGKNYAMGNESHLVRRLLREGHRAWYSRKPVVEHFIRKSQLQRKWILERAVRFGRGHYRIAVWNESFNPSCWFGVPSYLFREWLLQAGAAARTLFSGHDPFFQELWKLNFVRGQILEARLIQREATLRT